MRDKDPRSRRAVEGEPLGRYLLYDRIGRGGTASVHIGRLASLGGFSRIVALKKLHDYVAKEPNFVAMLLDEARLLSPLRHPNVVQILDIVEDGSSIALVAYRIGVRERHQIRPTRRVRRSPERP